MKTTAYGLFLAWCLACPALRAQDPDAQLANHLYYGNSGHDMRLMCFLAGGWAVGVGQERDWLYLLNPQGHLADSADVQALANTRGFGRFVGRLQPIAPSQVLAVCATANLVFEREAGKLRLVGNWQPGRMENDKSFWDGTFRVGHWLVGYERKKMDKRGLSGQDEDNFPQFWVRRLVTPRWNFGEPVAINPALPALTDDLYYDWKDAQVVQNLTQVHALAVNMQQGKFYFNVTRANRCYVFDTLTQQTSYWDYPPVTDGQSHFCYFDVEATQVYVVKKETEKSYVFYRHDLVTSQLARVGQAKEMPQGFVGGKVHFMRKVKLRREAPFWGHYLVPLDQASAQAEGDFKMLKVVEVKN